MATRKIALVTGGNNGIGYEVVKALLQSTKSYRVLMGSRSLDKARAAVDKLHEECPASNSTVEVVQVDLNSDTSIEKAYEQIKSDAGSLDVLINNAGATYDIDYLGGKVSLRECFNKAYDTNVAGTNVLTHVMMPLLLKSSDPRLIFVAGLSQLTVAAEKYFPTPPLAAGWPKKQLDFETIGYRCSKTALNMLMLDWNHKLKADGVKVWGVGPGMVVTDLGGLREKAAALGAGDASVSGQTIRSVVEGARDADVGKLVSKNGGFVSW